MPQAIVAPRNAGAPGFRRWLRFGGGWCRGRDPEPDRANALLATRKAIGQPSCDLINTDTHSFDPPKLLPPSTPDIEIVLINPQRLKPHPRNPFLYGEREDISELVEQIQVSGWIRPLLVTPKHVIISGHRRWRAALELGLEQVRVEVRKFANQTAQLEALLLENAARPKTREQLVREANAWKEVVAAKAKRRQKAGVRLDDEELVKIFAEGSRGNTRDLVAAKVGLGSGMTYAKAAKVVNQIDRAISEDDLETASAWRKILNTQSISAAYQLLLLPAKKREDILELIAIGEAETTKEAQFILEAASSDDERIFVAGDLAIINIDKVDVMSAKETQWNGCWGVIEDVLPGGIVTLNLGNQTLRLCQRDLELIAESPEDFQDAVSRVLRLRDCPLSEVEVAIIDVLQRQLKFSNRDLSYLEQIEQFYC